MDLKKGLDSIERTELLYIAAGIIVVAVAAVGLQYQNPPPETGEEQVQVSLNLDNTNGTLSDQIDVDVNSTAFDAVNQTYPVNYTEYDFGYFVTSIDGLAQNDTHSWLYNVNNESVTKAVNNYVLDSGDNVTFRYTSEMPQ